MKPALIRRALRLIALLAGLVWAALCVRAFLGPEHASTAQARAAAFVLAFATASFGWPPTPPKKGGRHKERL